MIAIACAIEPTQYLNEAKHDDVIGGLGEAGGYRERAANSSESESDKWKFAWKWQWPIRCIWREFWFELDLNNEMGDFEMANIDMLLYNPAPTRRVQPVFPTSKQYSNLNCKDLYYIQQSYWQYWNRMHSL